MVYATHIQSGEVLSFRTSSSFLQNCIIACEKFNALGFECKTSELGKTFDIVVI